MSLWGGSDPESGAPSGHHPWGWAVCPRPGAAGRAALLLQVLRAPVGQRGRSGGDPAGDNVAGCPARAGAAGGASTPAVRSPARCVHGEGHRFRSGLRDLAPLHLPAAFLLPFLFPSFLGRPFPLEEALDTHFPNRAPKSPVGSFPLLQNIQGCRCWGWLLGSIVRRQFLAWTSSGKPISMLCAVTPASDYAAHF